jgi:hypothetical protein
VRFSTTYNHTAAEQQTFRVPVATSSDTLATSVSMVQAALQQDLAVDLRPLRSLSGGFTWTQVRDLRNYGDSTTIGVLTRQDSRRLLGMNVGFERSRVVATRLTWQPALASWLRPRASLTSQFNLNRDATAPSAQRVDGDTAGAFTIPLAFQNQRTTDLGLALDLTALARGLSRDSSLLAKLFDRLNPVDVSTRSGLRSQFSQRGVTPGLGYQLALGGVDAFRAYGGQPADAARQDHEVRLAGGLRLPLGISLASDYLRQEVTAWARRADGQTQMRQTEVDWPSVTGRWVWSPRQPLVRAVLTSVSATASYRERETQTIQSALLAGLLGGSAAAGDVTTSQSTRSWPLSLTLNWAPRVITTFSYSGMRSASDQSGNVVQADRNDVGADLSFAFRVPPELIPLRSDVRTSLRYSNSISTGCIARAGDSTCVPISDSRRRQMNLTMDTDMPPNVSAGLGISYIVTADAHANRKFSQFVFTASVTVNFSAGGSR